MGTEARTITESNASEIAEWCQGRVVDERDALVPSLVTKAVMLRVYDGEVDRAYIGQTIVRNHNGQFWISKEPPK